MQINPKLCYAVERPVDTKASLEGQLEFSSTEFANYFSIDPVLLAKHVGESSEYNEPEFIKALHFLLVYTKERSETEPNLRKIITQLLNEGIENCSEGVHNRANNFILNINLTPTSISKILASMRTELVNTSIRTCSPRLRRGNVGEVSVHQLAFYTLVASTAGYGVIPTNVNDRYLSSYEEDKPLVLSEIKKAFEDFYHPLKMLIYIIEQIEMNLRSSYDYIGYKSGEGYTFIIYDKILDYFKLFIERSLDLKDVFILEEFSSPEGYECAIIHDLDWSKIINLVFSKMLHDNYFRISTEEQRVLDELTPQKIIKFFSAHANLNKRYENYTAL